MGNDHELYTYYSKPEIINKPKDIIKTQFDYLWNIYTLERFENLKVVLNLYKKLKVIIQFLFMFYNHSLEDLRHVTDKIIIPDQLKNTGKYFSYGAWLDSKSEYRPHVIKAVLTLLALNLENASTFDNWDHYFDYKDMYLWRDDIMYLVIKTVLETITIIYNESDNIKLHVKKLSEFANENYFLDENDGNDIKEFNEETQKQYYKVKSDISTIQYNIFTLTLNRIISSLKKKFEQLEKEHAYNHEISNLVSTNHINEIAYLKEVQKNESRKKELAKTKHQLEVLETSKKNFYNNQQL